MCIIILLFDTLLASCQSASLQAVNATVSYYVFPTEVSVTSLEVGSRIRVLSASRLAMSIQLKQSLPAMHVAQLALNLMYACDTCINIASYYTACILFTFSLTQILHTA